MILQKGWIHPPFHHFYYSGGNEAIVSQKLNITKLVSILQEVMIALDNHRDELQQLDVILGDGDMGITMELGSKAVSEYLASVNEKDIGKLLVECGLRFNRVNSSTFGTLFASALTEAGKACIGQEEIAVEDIVLIGQSAINVIKKRGKAEVGEKTILDPLVPSVEIFKEKLARNSDLSTAIESAIQAARTGMEATVQMKAKHSHASWRKDGGVGIQDAGATAMFYIIEAFGHGISRTINQK